MESEGKVAELNIDELSPEAYYALVYSLAVLERGRYERMFTRVSDKLGINSHTRRAAIRKGLPELAEKGAISIARNGEGDYEPVQVHVRLRESAGLILGEGV